MNQTVPETQHPEGLPILTPHLHPGADDDSSQPSGQAPTFFERLSQNSTLMGDEVSTYFPPGGSPSNLNEGSNPSSATSKGRGPAGTLFGAVMKKLSSVTQPTDETMLPPSTPDRAGTSFRSKFTAATKNSQKTALLDNTDRSPSKKAPSFMSPSGKSIMNVVNQFVMNSPFRFQSPKAKRKLPIDEADGDSKTKRTPSPARKRAKRDDAYSTPSRKSSAGAALRKSPLFGASSSSNITQDSLSSLHNEENWKEAPILNGRVEILDWALRTSLRLECHPPKALSGILHAEDFQEALSIWEYKVDHEVIQWRQEKYEAEQAIKRAQSISNGNRALAKVQRSMSVEGLATTNNIPNGKKFPATSTTAKSKPAPLARSTSTSSNLPNSSNHTSGSTVPSRKEAPAPSTKSLKAGLSSLEKKAPKDPDLVLIQSLLAKVRGPGATLSNNPKKSMGPLQYAQHEWREAFYSLYHNWLTAIEESKLRDPTAVLLDAYFYCLGHNHVVLFRATTDTPAAALGASSSEFYPEVIVTSCSDNFVQTLRDLGVAASGTRVVPDVAKEAHDKQHRPPTPQRKQAPMSPSVTADLEALRKAQAYGEVAGADVSVKIKAKQNSKMDTKKGIDSTLSNLAISLTGFDDVACFYEAYYNLHGKVREDCIPSQLPQLLAPRGLGSFLHSTKTKLQVFPAKPNKSSKNDQKRSPYFYSQVSGTLELQGIVLPGTIRRLVGVAAAQVEKEQKRLATLNQKDSFLTIRSPSRQKPTEPQDSHYIVLHTMKEEVPQPLGTLKGKVTKESDGTEISRIFNGLDPKKTQATLGGGDACDHAASMNPVEECEAGKGLQLVVWEASRNNVVACKIGSFAVS